jgi:ABC-type polysaccharide/polyol phosphate transport system ATPase subunit
MTEPRISLADAGKRYTKYEDAPMLASAALRFRQRTKRSKLWAVRHVDFEVAPGECVGVIGRNGSGKSTMLQMLAGVTAPTEGRVTVRGKVAPLISVGVGFHPELTGRENVYVNAAILGLGRAEVDRCFDSIIDFADIGTFVDTPVKFYSSGMFVRLGFAVAIHVRPSVLLIDEVLAVGDMAFQMKCFDKMNKIRSSGATIVIVSHNLNAVRRMCERTMVLHLGEHRFTGDTAEAISLYHELIGEVRDPDDPGGDPSAVSGAAGSTSGARVLSWQLLDGEGRRTAHAEAGQAMVFEAEVEFSAAVDDPVFAFSLVSEAGVVVYAESTFMRKTGRFQAGDRIVFRTSMQPDLATGSFRAALAVLDSDAQRTLSVARPTHFYLHGRNMVRGVADLGATFTVEERTAHPEPASAPPGP